MLAAFFWRRATFRLLSKTASLPPSKERTSTSPFYPWLLKKLVLKAEARLETLGELARMNINWATLTPSLNGFAASLCTEAETFSRTDSFTAFWFEDPII